ncbi:MAG TPA: methyltransferase [Terracidiphilus sp.]|jgi:methylase of polypeptide subunit release factors|nr:methyltransferase [Terracidiphilus sp.]
MLTPLHAESAQRLRAFFEETGYTEQNLRKHLGAAELPSRQLRNRARLLDRTSAPTPLNLLLRWFWIGEEVEHAHAITTIPREILALFLESGLLKPDGDSLVPCAMFLHIDGFLVASDHASAIEKGHAELVLWPNPTSKFLSRFAVRRLSRATLDLGTGSGILSLSAARFSEAVVATDLNPRAVACARFNARLNGIETIEVLEGDCFAPVANRRFDLILSNPPFFITPQAGYLFCDNAMDLDGLCRRLVKEACPYLNEDGYMEMLCEWAQIKGGAWEDRLAEWLEGTGCDAWVMKGLTQDPEEYAQHRIRETSQDLSHDADAYRSYMDYYRQRGVEAIHDGLIVLRRREGKNFVRMEEVPSTPSGNLGELILSTFAAHDLVRAYDTDEKLLGIHPRLSPHARLEQISAATQGRWQGESLVLRLISGFPFHLDLQPLVAEFLVSCDGTKNAAIAIEEFAVRANAPFDRVSIECLALIRKLIERGFMVAAESDVVPAAAGL